jgi:hypothetical protein
MGGLSVALHFVSGWLFANIVVVLYLAFLYSANRLSEQLATMVSLHDAAGRGRRRAEVLSIDSAYQSNPRQGF